MFGLGKNKVDPNTAASAFFDHMISVANATFENWMTALAYSMNQACDVDADWAGRFMQSRHQKRSLNTLYLAALVAGEAAGIRVCLEPKAATAVYGALHRHVSNCKPEDAWIGETIFRYIAADEGRSSMYDQPLLNALLIDMGFQNEPKVRAMIGHPIWSLTLVEALLNPSQAYWKRFAEKSQIRT